MAVLFTVENALQEMMSRIKSGNGLKPLATPRTVCSYFLFLIEYLPRAISSFTVHGYNEKYWTLTRIETIQYARRLEEHYYTMRHSIELWLNLKKNTVVKFFTLFMSKPAFSPLCSAGSCQYMHSVCVLVLLQSTLISVNVSGVSNQCRLMSIHAQCMCTIPPPINSH